MKFFGLFLAVLIATFGVALLEQQMSYRRPPSVRTTASPELFLARRISQGLRIKSYSQDGVDSVRRIATNTKGQENLVVFIESAEMPLLVSRGKDFALEMLGISGVGDKTCVVSARGPRACTAKLSPALIPMALDWDGDFIDEIAFYYFDTGRWEIYKYDGQTLTNFASRQTALGGYPVFLKNAAGRPQFGVWLEKGLPSFELHQVIDDNSAAESFLFGLVGDIPFTFDRDCDGSDSLGVYRRSTISWYFYRANHAEEITRWGSAASFPIIRDFDGDGCADAALYDRFANFTFAVLPSYLTNRALEIFPNGEGLIAKIKWGKPSESPPELWRYMLYKTYRDDASSPRR